MEIARVAIDPVTKSFGHNEMRRRMMRATRERLRAACGPGPIRCIVSRGRLWAGRVHLWPGESMFRDIHRGRPQSRGSYSKSGFPMVIKHLGGWLIQFSMHLIPILGQASFSACPSSGPAPRLLFSWFQASGPTLGASAGLSSATLPQVQLTC